MIRTMNQLQKAEQFRALHVGGTPLILFNVWDAGSAHAVAAGGAKAIATSSWSVAATNGFADGEHVPLELAIDNLRRIAGATDLPVTVDLERGYGEVGETIRSAIDAGAVGCNLEDSIAEGQLRAIEEQCDRIRRARQAADAAGLPFFINARTDVFFQKGREQHDDAMVAEALERAHAYANAGADGIFTPGLGDLALIGRLAEASPLPLNIMLRTGTASPRPFAERGVSRVSYGAAPYFVARKALEEAARAAMAPVSF
jgi:methylisocitrate lyase